MFSIIFKELRIESGLRQADLIEKLGITRTGISYWENNKSKPDIDMLIKIADLFNVSTDYLLGRTADITFKDEYQPKTNANEAQALKYFREVPERLQGRALGYLQALAESGKEGIQNA